LEQYDRTACHSVDSYAATAAGFFATSALHELWSGGLLERMPHALTTTAPIGDMDVAARPASGILPAEEVIQFSLSIRKGLRKQLARLADDADMTMRAFVLDALKAKGLDVRPDDLLDLRKERR
jgi:hypothetical protein